MRVDSSAAKTPAQDPEELTTIAGAQGSEDEADACQAGAGLYGWHGKRHSASRRCRRAAGALQRAKKAHKVKNNVLVSEAGRVVFLSRTHEGSKHDKMIVDEEGWLFPQGITLHQDLGFTGHKPGGVNVQMPDRKPRTRELSGEQKQQNKQKASIRVKVEHAIGRVKIYRVLKDRIRMYKRGIKDLVMDLGCGLNNFTLTCNA